MIGAALAAPLLAVAVWPRAAVRFQHEWEQEFWGNLPGSNRKPTSPTTLRVIRVGALLQAALLALAVAFG